MTRKAIRLCLPLLALLFCVSVFAAGSASEPTSSLSQSLSVGINGCFASGTGDFLCTASAFGGSGSYNYWWQHSGNGQLYQTNTATASISNCANGSFTLTVQIRDRVTQQLARSAPFTVSCRGGGGIGFGKS